MSSTPTLVTSSTVTFLGILTTEMNPSMGGGYNSYIVLSPFDDGDEESIEDIFKEYNDTIIQIEIKQFELISPDTRCGRGFDRVLDREYTEDDNG